MKLATPSENSKLKALAVLDTNPLGLSEKDLDFITQNNFNLASWVSKFNQAYELEIPYLARLPLAKKNKTFSYHRDVVREDASFKSCLRQAIKNIGFLNVLETIGELSLETYGETWLLEFIYNVETHTDIDNLTGRKTTRRTIAGNQSLDGKDDTTFISGYRSTINTPVPGKIVGLQVVLEDEFNRIGYETEAPDLNRPAKKTYSPVSFSFESAVYPSVFQGKILYRYKNFLVSEIGNISYKDKIVGFVDVSTRKIRTKEKWLNKSSLQDLAKYLDTQVNIFTQLKNLDNKKGVPHTFSSHEDGTPNNKTLAPTFVKPKRTKQKISWKTDTRSPRFSPESYPKVYKNQWVLFTSGYQVIQIGLRDNTRKTIGYVQEDEVNINLHKIHPRVSLDSEDYKRLISYCSWRDRTYPIPVKRVSLESMLLGK